MKRAAVAMSMAFSNKNDITEDCLKDLLQKGFIEVLTIPSFNKLKKDIGDSLIKGEINVFDPEPTFENLNKELAEFEEYKLLRKGVLHPTIIYIRENLENILEKAYGGKAGMEGEVRSWKGKDYMKSNGKWIRFHGNEHGNKTKEAHEKIKEEKYVYDSNNPFERITNETPLAETTTPLITDKVRKENHRRNNS
jgi:hypothetical protein